MKIHAIDTVRGFFRVHELTALVALHVAFLVTLGFLRISDSFENRIFERIVARATFGARSQRDSVLALLAATNSLVYARSNLLAPLPGERPGFKETFLQSADQYLLGSDACGSYALVLARLLQQVDRPVRVGQMRCDGRWGCHIFVEAKVDNQWAALDASYGLSFTRPDGRLASAKDVSSDWPYYSKQVPATYDLEYAYQGFRYTNWTKIPIVMPVAYRTLKWLGVPGVDELSIRTMLLGLYQSYSRILLVPYFVIVLVTIRKFVRRRRRLRTTIGKARPEEEIHGALAPSRNPAIF
jgi:hypothetical protein